MPQRGARLRREGPPEVSTEAAADLRELYDHIAERAGLDTADAYIERIELACRPLIDTPFMGAPQMDFEDGLRTIAFERRATIYYRIDGWNVVVDRIVPKGRDARRLFVRSRR